MKEIYNIGLLLLTFVWSIGHLNAQKPLNNQEFRANYVKNLKKNFPSISPQFYDLDSSWIITAKVKVLKRKKTVEFATSSSETKTYSTFAKLKFSIKNQKINLICYQPSPLIRIYRDYLFLPIKDKTASHTTYGAGRYLDIKVSEIKNQKIILDFNRLYNPLCAFDDAYSCPITPNSNELKIEIFAGEKKPLKREKE